MKLIYKGKTKDVFEAENGQVLLKFKDDVTGEDGVFDPGANTVGLTIEGMGQSGLRMTTYFFEKLAEKGIPTHFVESNLEEATMLVKSANMFGAGLEVICRYRAVGSFLKRYGAYCEEGQPLDAFVEVTLKDDKRNDPPINQDGLAQLGILTKAEYETLVKLTKEISSVVKDELAVKGLELYDIKLEFGLDAEGNMMLIDEISGGNMRAYKDGQSVQPLELEKMLLQ
ncbi:phosphoribosylaminoimidazolesuccinocarboxamide synthase [Sporosarcina ureilytica]|uniref:Phosphoribosylaminoimidazole-succinocarboxamide synthase n=1 Tax=Sporosarcina ureilytica TaxID=298596 RepID=A0A1D8JD06_9BACL|nr:phosphoribosylaminoimidazolesuccinocarboxamide synthase [Sporosarcina ureilytica]AOV06586.1 phosphoribosylaminoimidazolesuccinocarboxamide synthase [Sporosarcina ureilytica]